MIRTRLPIPMTRGPKEFVAGKNSSLALSGIHSNRAVVICSASFFDSKEKEVSQKLLKNANAVFIKKSWDGEPDLDALKSNLKEIEELRPDVIVAIGGGSVIDGAKILWLLYENPTLLGELSETKQINFTLRSKARFVVVPTTIGSGSEVSSSAIIKDKATRSKIPIVCHDFLPDVSILEPTFLKNVPRDVLISSVADALSHAIEGALSKINNPMMDDYAIMATRGIFENWKHLLEDELDENILMKLQLASTYAGYVQNQCMVGMSHCIAHQLADYGISHAYANAYLMPAVLSFYREDEGVDRKLRTIECASTGGTPMENIFEGIGEKLTSKVSFDFSMAQKEVITQGALRDVSFRVSARPFSTHDVSNVLEKTKNLGV